MLEIAVLILKTILLRPYVFLFLAAFLFSAQRLLGWGPYGMVFFDQLDHGLLV